MLALIVAYSGRDAPFGIAGNRHGVRLVRVFAPQRGLRCMGNMRGLSRSIGLIISIEDGLAENDWQGFTKMTAAQGDFLQIVDDDIFVTNPSSGGESARRPQMPC